MSDELTAAGLIKTVRADHEWNIACSCGCHDWVRGGRSTARRRYLKVCRNCDATYFCGRREWDRLPAWEATP